MPSGCERNTVPAELKLEGVCIVVHLQTAIHFTVLATLHTPTSAAASGPLVHHDMEETAGSYQQHCTQELFYFITYNLPFNEKLLIFSMYKYLIYFISS